VGGVKRIAIAGVMLAATLGCTATIEAPEARYAATVRARAWFENGDMKRATRVLRDLTRDSRDPVAWTNLGLARYRAGDTEAAERAWTQAVEFDRNAAAAHFWLGLLTRAQGRDELRRAQKNSRHADERREQARVLFESAAKSLETSIAADPSEPVAHLLLAEVRRDLADEPGVARASAEARRLDPAGLASLEASPLASLQLPPHPRPTSTGRIPVRFASQVLGFRASRLEVAGPDAEGRSELLLAGSGAVVGADSTPSGLRWNVRSLLGDRAVTSALRADIDADGRTDLVLFSSADSSKGASDVWFVRGGRATPERLLRIEYPITAARAVDLEPDGDPDLVLAVPGAPGLRVWRNTGARLEAGAAVPGLDALPAMRDVTCTDINGDRRPDLLCVDVAGRLRVLVQRVDGGFANVSHLAGLTAERARVIATADMDADGLTDLLLGNDHGLWVYANRGAARFVRAAAYQTPQTRYVHERSTHIPVVAMYVADVDNDGLPDVLTVHPRVEVDPQVVARATQTPAADREPARSASEDTAPELPLVPFTGPTGLRVWRNDGRGVLLDASEQLDVVGDTLLAIAPVAADLDRDGDQDLGCVRADSVVVVMWNDGGNANRRLRVELVGPRGTRDGSGARLELHVGALVQSVEVREQPVRLGIQHESKLGIVRIVWPDGKVENHLDVPVPADGTLRFTRGAPAS